jgi:hypothetical protein
VERRATHVHVATALRVPARDVELCAIVLRLCAIVLRLCGVGVSLRLARELVADLFYLIARHDES